MRSGLVSRGQVHHLLLLASFHTIAGATPSLRRVKTISWRRPTFNPPRSTTAQFNLGKLLLQRRRTEPASEGSVCIRGQAAGGDVREAKVLLRKVIRDNEEHSGARLCLAHTLAEEGGAISSWGDANSTRWYRWHCSLEMGPIFP